MPSFDGEKPGIATKGVYDSAFIHSGDCRLFIVVEILTKSHKIPPFSPTPCYLFHGVVVE